MDEKLLKFHEENLEISFYCFKATYVFCNLKIQYIFTVCLTILYIAGIVLTNIIDFFPLYSNS